MKAIPVATFDTTGEIPSKLPKTPQHQVNGERQHQRSASLQANVDCASPGAQPESSVFSIGQSGRRGGGCGLSD